MKFLPLIWAGLWRKRARTVFTLLSITVAFLLFGLLQGVNAWIHDFGMKSHANRLYVASRVSMLEPLPIAHLSQIQRIPGVRHATYVGLLAGTYQERGNDIVAWTTDVSTVFDIYSDWRVPAEQLTAMTRTRNGAIVGAKLMSAYGWKIGDRLPLRTGVVKQGGSADWDFEIVGVYDVPGDPTLENHVLVNYAYFDEARWFDKGRVYAFLLEIDDPARSQQTCAAIDALFANSADETFCQNEKEYVQGQIRQIGDIGLMVNGVVGAVLFTLLFLTANTMMLSVRERIPELAVLKTIGFVDNAVTALVLAEALLLCLAAALLGLALAASLFPLTAALGIAGTALPLKIIVSGVSISAALALASGLPPAWRARRMTIVDALAGR